MGSSVQGLSEAFNFASLAFVSAGGMMIMVGLIYTLPTSNSLEIEDSGFSYRAGWRRVFCRWEDCSEFYPWNKKVFGFKANELVTFDAKTPPSQAKTNISATGHNSVLPGTYGLSCDELAAKLNEYRRSYLANPERLKNPFEAQEIPAGQLQSN
jgi:hypothetical protein